MIINRRNGRITIGTETFRVRFSSRSSRLEPCFFQFLNQTNAPEKRNRIFKAVSTSVFARNFNKIDRFSYYFREKSENEANKFKTSVLL